jgi:pimeloyl-ACP methyl ester carboxylesterase
MRDEVRRVRRPVGKADAESFGLTYVRCGPVSKTPLLVLPGGPGLASVRPYRGLRAAAAAQGLSVVMVEHRGVGLSRRGDDGSDLPLSALTVEQTVADLAAVLDDIGAERAFVYGSSYGSYLAQGLAVRHPDRVAGLVLDSPMLRADRGRPHQDALRRLFWEGDDPATARAAGMLRGLVENGTVPADEAATVVQIVYEAAGPGRVEQLLDLMAAGRGRRTWKALRDLGTRELQSTAKGVMEFDLVGTIAFRELGYAPLPDGLPLQPNLEFLTLADRYPPFDGEPYDLPRELPRLSCPTGVVSGDRDLRTPRAVAQEVVGLVPGAVLVALSGCGHSALDTRPRAALQVAQAVVEGRTAQLPAQAERLSRLPAAFSVRALDRLLGVQLAAARLAPSTRRGANAPQPG